MPSRAPELGGLVHAASGALWTLGDRALGPLGVTSAQWKVLTLLARSEPLRIAQVTAALGADQAAISRLVDRLEREGLVARGADPDDLRAARVTLTRRGRRVHARCRKVLAVLMTRLLSRLPARGRRALVEDLARFVESARLELGAKPPNARRRRA